LEEFGRVGRFGKTEAQRARREEGEKKGRVGKGRGEFGG